MSDPDLTESSRKRRRLAKSPVDRSQSSSSSSAPASASSSVATFSSSHLPSLAIRNILSDTGYPSTTMNYSNNRNNLSSAGSSSNGTSGAGSNNSSGATVASSPPKSSTPSPLLPQAPLTSIALTPLAGPAPFSPSLTSGVETKTLLSTRPQQSPTALTFVHAPSSSSSNSSSSSQDKSLTTTMRQKATRNPRAARACSTCRKQKTRCFPAQTSKSCFRCLSLGLTCSLCNEEPDDIFPRPALPEGMVSPGHEVLEKKLDGIKIDVSQVLELLRDEYRTREDRLIAGPSANAASGYLLNGPSGGAGGTVGSGIGGSNGTAHRFANASSIMPSFGYCSLSYVTSPFNTYGMSVRPALVPAPIQRLLTPQMVSINENVITMQLLTRSETIRILDVFLKYYNQWVSFPSDIKTENLLDLMLLRSSLLLTVCCAVVIRYHDPELKRAIWKPLLTKLHSDLKATMLIVPHTIEFIQALAVMSIYGSSLSDDEDVIDAWFVSSMGLQHFITKDTLGLVISFDGESPVTAMDEITGYRVWNHLCLVHVVNCNLSGRMMVLDEIRLNQSRRTLDLSACSNFDGRMVAEINLQVLIYNFIEFRQTLDEVEEELKLWHNDWGYLFEQPTTQFVETGYHFGYFLVLYHWNHRLFFSSSITQLTSDPGDVDRVFASMDNSTLRRLIRHAIKILDGVLVVKELLPFMALSDQIHFFGAYAAVMLARLIDTALTAKSGFSLTDELITIALTRISLLAERFKQLDNGNGQNTLAARYATSITEASQALFMKPT